MVTLNVMGIVPLVVSVIMAVLAAVSTRCLTMEDSYKAVPWGSLVLLGGMLPLADALDKTGGVDFTVDMLMSWVGGASPLVMMTLLFFLTAILSLFLSNIASAVLVAPVAITSAEALNLSPYPFALSVIIAASAVFISPVSTPVIALIVTPGKYRVLDFIKVGGPLLVLVYCALILIGPLLFPF
jgi:di/tricarboxylate transporter